MLKFLEKHDAGATRRQFLQVLGLGAAGLVVGCVASPPSPTTATPSTTVTPATAALQELNAFVKIGSDDRVTVVVKHAEFGQGSSTGLTALVAEELDADWGQMSWEFAPADAKRYANLGMGIQGTGGSSAIANSWEQLRQAGAGARALLVQAAAQAWGVPAAEIRVEKGKLSHSSGKSGGFGEFAEAAAKQTLPKEIKLKDPKDFQIIGKPLPRLDGAAKSSGRATFTIDKQLPGLRVAVVAHPPRFGGKVKSVDDKAALAVPGVFEVVTIPRGVAVVARDFWSAQKGRQALKVEWDDSQAEKRGSEQIFADYRKQLQGKGALARDEGKAPAVLAAASKRIELDYQFPYLAHAPMEPLDCVVEWGEDGGANLYYGAQLHTVDQANAAATLKVPIEKLQIHSLFGGGSFGRRATPDSDYVVECCSILAAAKEKAPIKLMWDRGDDLRGGRYRPMSVHKITASLTAAGKVEAVHHRMVVQSFLAGSPFAMMIKNGVDGVSVEGAATTNYQFPNHRVEVQMGKVGIPTLWWRSVGHTYNAFVMETFIDALAHAAQADPVEFRRGLLPKGSRPRGVLDLVVAKAGPAPKGPGKGRGIAVHESFRSFVAQVVDITVQDGKLKVDKVTCAVDCGVVVNPDQVRAQMESGIVYGLSAATREAITLKEGVVEQGNFDSYPVIRMPDVPPIEVHLVTSAQPPTGTGEPGTPPLAPALANAIFQATGKRLTRLPLKLEEA